MSEELIQRDLIKSPEKIGHWDFYNIGATSLKALKVARIIPNKDYKGLEKKKPDALIVNKPQVIAAIEYKQPKELRTKKQIAQAIDQELSVATALGARLYIVTDGQKTFWINPLTGNEITDEGGSRIALNFDKNNVDCIKFIHKAIASINVSNNKVLASAVVDPLPLAQKVWQDLWAVSGATPENCLYTFVELFIFKYLSDLGLLTGMYSFANLLNQYSSNTENEVLEYYASTVRVKIKELFPLNPKDKTTIINGTIFVSKDDKAVGGYATVFKKILYRFQEEGVLDNIDYDFKSKLFETFLKESISKKNWGQFFTPIKVVRAIANMVDVAPGMKVCDPACGVGKFLLELILHDIHRWFDVKNNKLISKITLHGFDKGFDKYEQKTIILAKANMLIYMSAMIRKYPGMTKEFSNLFNDTFFLQMNSILGTLANPSNEEYDLILTNPPYVMSGSSNLKDEISKKTQDEIAQKQKTILEQYYSINAMGVEGLFMEWIVRALVPGGKAFVIVPDGVMNRSNDKRLRDFILEECIIDAIISLPLNTFFTTNKKTYIMAVTKKVAVDSDGIKVKEKQITPVFTYLCSEIGETRDVYRFDIEQNDLDDATTLFNMFKGVRGKLPIENKRCKIVSIDEFYNGSHWSVERWWTREEKIELGIEEESETIAIGDFASVIGDLSNTLLEYKDSISGAGIQKKKSVNNKSICIADLFDVKKGNSKYTNKYFSTHTGEYPVYSSQTKNNGIIATIDTYDIDCECITWTTDGVYAGTPFYHNNEKFSMTTHCGALVLKSEYADKVNLKYLFIYLSIVLRDYAIGNGNNRLTVSMIKDVCIDLPLDKNGNYDLELQGIIAEQFLLIKELKSELKQKCSEIKKYNLEIDLSEYPMREYPLSKLLTPSKGKSKYTRKYGDKNKGEYPVYSASQTALTHINTFDYDGDYLSWSTNGFAGTVSVLKDKFSINGDRGLLIPNQENLDIHYLKYILQPIFRQLAKGRKGDHGTDEFTKLYPSMVADVKISVPVDSKGKISLSAQQEIAKTYSDIEQYKSEILDKLNYLIVQKVALIDL